MAFRLVDRAQMVADPVQQGTMETFAQSSALMNALSFVDAPTGVMSFKQRTALPTSTFRGQNEGYGESTSRRERVTERVFPMGNDSDVDSMDVMADIGDIRGDEAAATMVDMAHLFDYTFVKGTGELDEKDFEGLQVRLEGDQVVDNGTAGLSLGKLDEAIDRCSNASHILLPRATIRAMSTYVNTTSTHSIRTEKGDFGRRVMFYNDLPLLPADPIGHSRNPLPFTEASSTASIYVLNLSPNDGVHAIQMGNPSVRDLGEVDDAPKYRIRVDWHLGLCLKSPTAAVRLSGITNAATTA